VRAWVRKDGWAIAGSGILVLITIWYFGFHSARFTVTDVTIDGLQFLKREDVQPAVDSYLHSKMLGVVSHNTYWTLNSSALQEAIVDGLSESSALESVEVSKKYPNRVTITVHERIPAVTWVIKNESGVDQYFTVDRDGRVAQALANAADALTAFPTIRDENHVSLEVGTQVVSADYMNFLLNMNTQFPQTTNLQVASYIFPQVECQEKQYVTEQILEDEISDSASEEFRQQKIAIQEKFQRGELTVDQSLEALEQIKEAELAATGQVVNTNGTAAIQWQAVYVPTDCDFTKVAHDVYIVTTEESGGFTVYMDSTVDPAIQMENLNAVLQTKITDRTRVHYIDARFVDRVYYQ
jgi:hypothetical protein